MFTKIIELLLQEKADLDRQKALDIEEAIKAINDKYAEHSVKLDTMLSLAGYEMPVEELVEEDDDEEEEDGDGLFYDLTMDNGDDEDEEEFEEEADEVDDGAEVERGKALYTI